MSVMTIHCTCGRIVEGRDADALLSAAKAHIGSDHPELLAKLGDDDILAMADVDEKRA